MEKIKEFEEICQKLASGNPPDPQSGLFGADFPLELSRICLLGVPWDVTTSGYDGTSQGVEAIIKASHELDLFDYEFGAVYEVGIHMETLPNVLKRNLKYRKLALDVMAGKLECLADINQASDDLNQQVYERAKQLLGKGKLLGLVGGDHSCPFGLIKALAERSPIGILHIDAHHDLREHYCGFTSSHASIFRNVLSEISGVERLVSLGIRDFSMDERRFAESQGSRLVTFYDEDLYRREAEGVPWVEVCEEILDQLPQDIYVSVDVDGLSREYCPSTGTPVPGGLSYRQLCYLFSRLKLAGKRVRGFDLVEVSPNQDGWDANVGARLIYKLCGLLKESHS